MAADSPRDLLSHISGTLRRYIESLQESGVTGLPLTGPQNNDDPRVPLFSPRPLVTLSSSPPPPTKPAPSSSHQVVSQAGDLFLPSAVHTVRTLEELREEIGDCRRCKLCQGRTNIVFGVGNPQAELVFVGEGPGRDEDLKGEPFVGRAGQLLTEIITKGMKMRREDVYIANVVKCRPPENRNPEPDEIASCEPFLLKQLELIQPRIIVALGTFAAQTLLKTKTPISRLRGSWHSYHGIKLMPTLHPAYLLRNPNDKRLVWQDIQAVLREMGRL